MSKNYEIQCAALFGFIDALLQATPAHIRLEHEHKLQKLIDKGIVEPMDWCPVENKNGAKHT